MEYIKMRTFKKVYKAKGKHKSAQLAYLIPFKSRGFIFTMKKHLKG